MEQAFDMEGYSMDDSGSVEECNFYSNVVCNFILDSDDENIPKPSAKVEETSKAIEAPKIETVHTLPSTTRQQRRQTRRECSSPIYTQGGRRKRARLCRTSSWQNKDSFDYTENEMLNIIEINDDCSPPQVEDFNEFDADEVEIIQDCVKTKDVVNKGLSDLENDVEEDLEVAVHVKWRMKGIKKFYLKKTDVMKKIFQEIAQEEGIMENQISFTFNEKPVSTYDTLGKFNSTVVVLKGHLKVGNNSTEQADPNQIELKVLRKDKKNKLSVFISRSDTLEVFMEKAAEKMDIRRSKLVFKFDGEIIDSQDTPESLDLDGGECIEVVVQP